MKRCRRKINFRKIRVKTISDPEAIFLYFIYNRRRIGEMYLIEYRKGFFETHSFINFPSFKKKGLGIFMYIRAAKWASKNKVKLRSSKISWQSHGAQRLWQSARLREKCSIYKTGDRWVIELIKKRKPSKKSGHEEIKI